MFQRFLSICKGAKFALILFGAICFAALGAETGQPKARYFRPPEKHLTVPRQAGSTVVVNAASFLPGVSPGGLATIFGENLTDVAGTVSANSNPLPTMLANVEVDVNGVPAPIFSISFANGQDQISFQVPYEAPTGPNAVTIDVFDYGNHVAQVVADSFIEDPGIFMYGPDNIAVAQRAVDGSLIGRNNPASPGDIIILYATALGPLSIALQDGVGAPSNPLAYTVDPFQAIVDGKQCQVLFSGLGPGFVGLYQLNLQLPPDLPSGNLNIQITTPYASSQVATLPVF